MGTTLGPIAAVAVAIVALTAGLVAGTIAIAKWAVGLSDANRTQGLLAAGITQTVAGGQELDATITRLGGVVPQTREELLGMAGDLAKTGLKGQALGDALEAAAVKAAKAKFGPEWSKQMLSLDVQSKRLGANLASTFGGLKIEGLLQGFSTLVALFDSSTESGKALKFLFESLFQPIIDGVTAAIPTVERLFLQAEILALKAYIALKPYSEEIKLLGEAFAVVAAVIVGGVAVSLALALAPVVALIAGITLLVAWIIKLGEAIYNGLASAIAFVSEIGSQIVAGIVNGITGGASAVVKAITDLGTSALSAFDSVFHFGSPSKVMRQRGEWMGEGAEGGIEDSSPDVQGALESMVAPPDVKGGALAARGGGGVSLVIQTLNVQGASAKEQAFDFLEQVTKLFENDAMSLGGGEAPAGA
jgi:hypothetical protein